MKHLRLLVFSLAIVALLSGAIATPSHASSREDRATAKLPFVIADIALAQTNYTFCAEEGQRCNFSGTKDVFYGANGKNTYKYSVTGGIDCNNQTFGGDPNPGVQKRCYIKDSIGTTYLNPAKGYWTKAQGAVYKYASTCFAFGGTADTICDVYEIHLGWNYIDAKGNKQVGWAKDANGKVVKIPFRDYKVINTPSQRSEISILAEPQYPWWINYPSTPPTP